VDLTRLLGPGQPVLRIRSQVDRPETIEEGRIHLVDGIRAACVDCCKDASVGVKLPAIELAIEDDLEGSLHDLGGGSVELIEEEADR